MSKNINMSKKISPIKVIDKHLKFILKSMFQNKFHDKHLKFILKSMIQYQKLNNTKRHCIDNVQYYRDNILNPHGNIKVRAVMCYCKQIKQKRKGDCTIVDANVYIVCAHLVVVYNNKIIDPSYEISKLNPNYYFTLKDFVESVPLEHHFQNGKLSKKQVKEHLDFVELAEKINNQSSSDPLTYYLSLEYYNKQADYVDKCVSNNPMYKIRGIK